MHELVEKLTGKIMPVGETNEDDRRYENLIVLCDLVEKLVSDIDAVSYNNKDRVEFSIKRAAKHASDFMTKRLGIED